MKKIAIMTDSNSGITQKQGEELGVTVLPMPFLIDGKEYFEDMTLSQDEFYNMLEQNADVGTSQPAIGHIMDTWDNLLKDYDEIVHIPMSSGLSGSYETALMLAEDYGGRVEVVNNQRISVTQRQSVLDAMELVKADKTARQIKHILEDTKFESSIYITVDTLKYLKKGGRITAAAAAVGTILNLKPVLQIQGEKLDAFAKARGMKQAKRIMIEAMLKDFETRFADAAADKKIWLQVAHTHNEEAALEFIEELKETFPGYNIHVDPLSLSVACHIGPGALAIACTKMLKTASL